MAAKELLIGIAEAGIMHTDPAGFDIDTRFAMVKDAGVFDYYDKTPPVQDLYTYKAAVQKHGVPMTAGGFYYFLGRDEPLLEWHLRVGKELGTRAHNVQIISHDVNRQPVTDEQVIATYLRAAEVGEETGVTPCFEVHVNMWSEHFGRIAKVAQAVEAQGVKFNMTLDHSHVIFKIDNPRPRRSRACAPTSRPAARARPVQARQRLPAVDRRRLGAPRPRPRRRSRTGRRTSG
jgi:sugar phosphate isomerase/epimerase